VTFHGSKTNPNLPPNNICAYDASGNPLPEPVLQTTGTTLKLEELRGMAFGSDGSLYVANANKNESMVLHYSSTASTAGVRTPVGNGVFSSSSSSNPGLVHPYGLAFGPAGTSPVLPQGALLASSQDTDVVTALAGASGKPAPTAPAWANTNSPAGTLAPSASTVGSGTGGLEGPRGVTVLAPGRVAGVMAPPNADPADGILYVADATDNSVKAYDATTGQYYAKVLDGTKSADLIGRPVGLTIHDEILYVTGERTNNVVGLDLGSGNVHLVAGETTSGVTLDHPSGIAFGPDGRLYVNSRVGRQVLAYVLDGSGHKSVSASVFIDKSALPDQPEQLDPIPKVPASS
jgi:hypothetical protein